jgi:hypothetical protein
LLKRLNDEQLREEHLREEHLRRAEEERLKEERRLERQEERQDRLNQVASFLEQRQAEELDDISALSEISPSRGVRPESENSPWSEISPPPAEAQRVAGGDHGGTRSRPMTRPTPFNLWNPITPDDAALLGVE